MEPLTQAQARQYSPLALAFLGDSVYEILVREYLVREGLTAKGYHVLTAEVMQIPATYTTLEDEESIKKMNLLLENLEENDDVQNVYHNWSMPEEE